MLRTRRVLGDRSDRVRHSGPGRVLFMQRDAPGDAGMKVEVSRGRQAERDAAAEPSSEEGRGGLRTFLLVWAALVVSHLGSSVRSFALDVSVYQHTGSATLYGLVGAAALLPQMILAPFAGVAIDRWGVRAATLVAQAGAGACSLVLALFLQSDALGVPALLVMVTLSASFAALQIAALVPTATQLVAREHLGRINGLLQVRLAICQVLAPIMAGALLPVLGLHAIVLADAATRMFAVVVLLMVHFPRTPSPAAVRLEHGSALAFSLRFLRRRSGLLRLLLLLAVQRFYFASTLLLLTPMVLGFADSYVLGTIVAGGGIGYLIGSVVMTAWGGPRRRVSCVLGLMGVQGCLMLLGAWQPSALLIGAGVFGVLFTEPLLTGCHTAIWQRQVPVSLQGRVLGVQLMSGTVGTVLAFVSAGALQEHVVEPWMAADGPLSPTLGRFLGTGPGRGATLLLAACGLLTIVSAIGASLDRRLRRVDDEAASGS